MKRRSLYFPSPLAVEVRDESLPPLRPGQALVETVVSAISSGTEMLVYRGQAPEGMAVDETIETLGGSFGFPIKFGYAAAGRVIEVGPNMPAAEKTKWLGRLVFAFNPHETHFMAELSELYPIPSDISPEAAVLLPNMETAVSLVMDGLPVIGERVTVWGQGIVGLLTTGLLASLPLTSLVTLDAYGLRREWSRELGATAALDPLESDVQEQALRFLGGDRMIDGADLTYELTGNPQALDTAIALTGSYGRVIIGSWYGQKPVELNLGGRFHRSHIRLIASQVSTLSPQWLGRWTKNRRLEVAWEMIRRLHPERLITHRLPLEQATDAYPLLQERPQETVQIILTYHQVNGP